MQDGREKRIWEGRLRRRGMPSSMMLTTSSDYAIRSGRSTSDAGVRERIAQTKSLNVSMYCSSRPKSSSSLTLKFGCFFLDPSGTTTEKRALRIEVMELNVGLKLKGIKRRATIIFRAFNHMDHFLNMPGLARLNFSDHMY